jgi:hypothetical protein
MTVEPVYGDRLRERVILLRRFLPHLGEVRAVPFSMRLERRALQLASAMSLTKYFNVKSDVIPIDSVTARMATQFFVEEAWVRSNEGFPIYDILRELFSRSFPSHT